MISHQFLGASETMTNHLLVEVVNNHELPSGTLISKAHQKTLKIQGPCEKT